MALIAMFFAGAALSAQTPKEIISKMSAEMNRGEDEGFSMDFTMKMPIIGTVTSHNLIRGDKLKTIVSDSNKSSIGWSDETTMWSYDSESGEITIETKTSSAEKKDDSNLEAFDNIDNGYDITLQKETDEAWYFLCKKSKSNKVKDDPKKIELAVSKATYLPIYMRTKQSFFTISIENYTLGVSEESVTFDPAEYPDAKIIDKR